uniref:Uncharacterized protein n=1 Tax=Anopheles culicifacies TaxID=139723 RepID=A0A182LZ42_9DIPT
MFGASTATLPGASKELDPPLHTTGPVSILVLTVVLSVEAQGRHGEYGIGQVNDGHQGRPVDGGQLGGGHQGGPVGGGPAGGCPHGCGSQPGLQGGFGGQHNGGHPGSPMFVDVPVGGVPLGGSHFGDGHQAVPLFIGATPLGVGLHDGGQRTGFQGGYNRQHVGGNGDGPRVEGSPLGGGHVHGGGHDHHQGFGHDHGQRIEHDHQQGFRHNHGFGNGGFGHDGHSHGQGHSHGHGYRTHGY